MKAHFDLHISLQNLGQDPCSGLPHSPSGPPCGPHCELRCVCPDPSGSLANLLKSYIQASLRLFAWASLRHKARQRPKRIRAYTNSRKSQNENKWPNQLEPEAAPRSNAKRKSFRHNTLAQDPTQPSHQHKNQAHAPQQP